MKALNNVGGLGLFFDLVDCFVIQVWGIAESKKPDFTYEIGLCSERGKSQIKWKNKAIYHHFYLEIEKLDTIHLGYP